MTKNEKQDWPIIEALAEFNFDPTSEWNGTIPGLMFGDLGEDFPDRRQKRLVNTIIRQEGSDLKQEAQIVDRLQFFRTDGTALVQVNQHLLSVNRLKPYTEWEELKPLAQKALDSYVKHAEPKGLKQVSLHYINELHLGEGRVSLRDSLQFYPTMGPTLSQDSTNFNCIVQQARPSVPGLLIVQLATKDTPGETPSLVLNLSIRQEHVAMEGAMLWLDRAHEELNLVFRGCIADKLYQQFKGSEKAK